MKVNDFKSRLKSGNLSGAYLFAGEEDYLKKFYLNSLISAVVSDESLAPFNHIVYDGEKINFAALYDAVKAPPMMSDYKLVEWRYPNLNTMKEEEFSALEELLRIRAEHDYTVLSFITSYEGLELGTEKKPSKFESRFSDKMSIIRLDKSTDSQLIQWIGRHFNSEGVKYAQDVPSALVFRSGRSMQVLKNEIDKLTSLAKARNKEISAEDVELVATPTTECDTFAFSNAILARDKNGAFKALADMRARRVEPTVIVGMAARVICDLVSVANLADEGLGADKIASMLSMNPYKLSLYLSAAKSVGWVGAEALLSELARVDTAAKLEGVGGYTAVELFITRNM